MKFPVPAGFAQGDDGEKIKETILKQRLAEAKLGL